MKISLSWLNDFVDAKKFSVEDICETLTACGLESNYEESFNIVKSAKDLIVGEIVDCWKHPNADKLQCTLVDIGTSQLNIVCGAPNARKGIKVVVAPVGTKLETFSGENFKIKKSTIRGKASEGMLCAEDEIGLSNDHEKIIELDPNLANGSSLQEIFPDQEIINIDITPNRADACSHLGVARDLKAAKKLYLHFPDLYKFKTVINNPRTIKICKECSRFSSVVIKNIHITESPRWIKERLNSVGVRSINNIVDITNYVMLELGQPIHAYDLTTLDGDEIFVRKSNIGEKILALNNETYELTGNELVVADTSKVLGLAGIMGGVVSSVKDNTKEIFLESAYFDASIVRYTSKKLNLKSEASYRFERGVDPCMTLTALQRACFLLQQQQPEIVIEKVTDTFLKQHEPRKIFLSYEKVRSVIGIDICNATISDILNRLDIKLENVSNKGVNACVPLYRVDVCRDIDLIEEILRIYGYDNVQYDEDFKISIFKNQLQSVSDKFFIKKRISNILAARGFQEIFTNSLTSNDNESKDKILIVNSVNANLNAMRISMVPSTLEVIDYNFNHGQKKMAIFEIGKTYHKDEKENISEIEHCICAVANKKQKTSSFFDLKNETYNILRALNLNNLEEKLVKDGVEVFYDKKKICEIKNIFHDECEISYADIFLDNIDTIRRSVYNEISKFPAVIRDLSLIIKKDATYQDIKKVVEDFDSEIIKDYKVVDVYENENSDQKTYTISFVLQSLKHTLHDKEIQSTMTRLILDFENKINAKINL